MCRAYGGIKMTDKTSEIVSLFLDYIKNRDLSDATKFAFEQSINRCLTLLKEAGRTTDPRLIAAEDILYLKNTAMCEMELVTRRYYLSFLKQLMEFCDNRAFDKVDIHWRLDQRTNADWLDTVNAKRLLTNPTITVPQRMAIALELTMGLRRVEIIRLTMDKIYSDHIVVIGKGRGGGKPRTVPVSNQFLELLPSFRAYRQGIILDAVGRNGGDAVEVPNNLYLNIQGKRLCKYSEHGVGFDKAFVIPVREKMRFNYGNHTLRRTFGRQLWKNKVEIETIAKILGHENTKTTLEYIGANLDDMKSAIGRLSFD